MFCTMLGLYIINDKVRVYDRISGWLALCCSGMNTGSYVPKFSGKFDVHTKSIILCNAKESTIATSVWKQRAQTTDQWNPFKVGKGSWVSVVVSLRRITMLFVVSFCFSIFVFVVSLRHFSVFNDGWFGNFFYLNEKCVPENRGICTIWWSGLCVIPG